MKVFFQPILSKEEWDSGVLSSFMVYRDYLNAKIDFPNHTIAAYAYHEIEDPTFVDDEDDKTTTYYVDIPELKSDGTPSSAWRNIKTFKVYEEALQYVQDYFGADDQGRVKLISY